MGKTTGVLGRVLRAEEWNLENEMEKMVILGIRNRSLLLYRNMPDISPSSVSEFRALLGVVGETDE